MLLLLLVHCLLCVTGLASLVGAEASKLTHAHANAAQAYSRSGRDLCSFPRLVEPVHHIRVSVVRAARFACGRIFCHCICMPAPALSVCLVWSTTERGAKERCQVALINLVFESCFD